MTKPKSNQYIAQDAISLPSNDDKPPPIHEAEVLLKPKDNTHFTGSEMFYLMGKKSDLDENGSLPYIPPGISNVTELRHTVDPANSYHIENVTMTPELETKIKLVNLTNTYLDCYIAPPEKTFINMFDVSI